MKIKIEFDIFSYQEARWSLTNNFHSVFCARRYFNSKDNMDDDNVISSLKSIRRENWVELSQGKKQGENKMVNEKQKGVIYIYSDNGPGFMPTRATPRAAGYDIMATSDFSVKYGETFKMDSGLIIDASYIEEELAYFLVPRSSSGGANIRFANTIGLIEPHEFRGPEDKLRVDIEVRVDTGDPVSFKKGDRIGQIVFFEPKHYPHQYAGTSAHHPGGDSRGGFGSTGA